MRATINHLMAALSVATPLLLAGSIGCGTGNPYLAKYRLQTEDEEAQMLSKNWPAEAADIFAAKQKLRTDSRNEDAMLRLVRAYASIAEGITDLKDPLREYSLEAAGYELKLYKARGGGFPPPLVAETGKNLYMRGDWCRGSRWMKKAIELDTTLAAGYSIQQKKAERACNE